MVRSVAQSVLNGANDDMLYYWDSFLLTHEYFRELCISHHYKYHTQTRR